MYIKIKYIVSDLNLNSRLPLCQFILEYFVNVFESDTPKLKTLKFLIF